MGLDKAGAVSDPKSNGKQDRAPDSGPLQVSLNTQFESGIPPARLRQDFLLQGSLERVELALENAARTEANLGLLIRGFKHLVAGALAVREANTQLMQELDALRAHLTLRNEEEHALRFRTSQLEQLLHVMRQETTRERQFLVEQQDLFLVQIMLDHERQITDLRRSLLEANTRSQDMRQRELDELTAQRDQAREYATRCERERDAAWHELAASEAAPAPRTIARPASSAAPRARATPLPRMDPARPEFFELRDEQLCNSASQGSRTAIGAISLRPVQAPSSPAAAPDTERASEHPTSGTQRPR